MSEDIPGILSIEAFWWKSLDLGLGVSGTDPAVGSVFPSCRI